MAELTFKSAGVSVREIDLSQPTPSGPQGVPAGIIGTALGGPAFIPITVSNFTEFESIFGGTDGEKFGPMAVNQWLKSARACTYIRVLGVGDGKKRNDTTGVVTNAGFVVGDQQIQATGIKGNNVYSNNVITEPVKAKLVIAIPSGNGAGNNETLSFTVDGKNYEITFKTGTEHDASHTTWQGSSPNYTADVGLDDGSGDSATDLEVLAAIQTLAALVGGEADGSNFTATKDDTAKTVTIEADVPINSDFDFSSVTENCDTLTATATAGVSPVNSPKGRTYFLGCFMSESNGSTIFSDAGIQQKTVKATAVDAIDLDGFTAASGDASFVFTIPVSAGGTGVATTILLDDDQDSDPVEGTNIIAIAAKDSAVGTDDAAAALVIKAINGVADSLIDPASAGEGQGTDGIKGIIASEGSNNKKITLTMAHAGVGGNVSNALDTQTYVDVRSFTGGSGGAVPILRGVVLAPSGVILHLSGNASNNGSGSPVNTNTALDANGGTMGFRGALTGSVTLADQQFVMLMNGYAGSSGAKTIVTASFDMTSPDYFGKVLNTDPFKIEEKGHLLYAQYDVHPNVAVVTGSGVFQPGHASKGAGNEGPSIIEDIGFLLTGSNLRGATSNLNNVPDYEDFKDRFSHAETPFFISQSDKKLFKLVSLSPGANVSNQFKVSIENIVPSTSKTNKYGNFDVVIRDFNDTDTTKSVIESFRGVSLDPTSDRYIARLIGDINTYFDFDSNAESQKIITEGSHPNRSRYVRVVISDDVTFKNIDPEDLPIGYRGPRHLVTSGTMLSNESNTSANAYVETDAVRRVNEPPIPYRQHLEIGTGLNAKIEPRFYWGAQFSQVSDGKDPNKIAGFNKTFESYAKHFPTHRKDTSAFSVGDNTGVADVNGSILDSDRFNFNKFSLLNIRVRTGSMGANPEMWHSASYVRSGSIIANDIKHHQYPGIERHNNTGNTRGFLVSDLKTVANRKYAKFTAFFQGGFDGVDMFNKDKQNFLNASAKREIDDSGQFGASDSTIAAYRKAIDIMGSKTDVDIQLLATPGMRHTSITDYAISSVENRFDAMYIMDIEERDQLNDVVTSSVQHVHVANTIIDFKNRGLDTSFAAAYFPNVTIVDPTTHALVDAPPSIAVLGAMANNDRIGHPWFAPAGFARGGLDGVETESVKLSRENLDELYDSDINPITSFPSTGVTIWGQKTLLQDQSALDRINVRRLLIDVRRKVRNVANSLLFEPNREETLERFSALVNPILQRVQTLSGVERFKVVIDSSTTTQADIENNTIRGKIFLQPTRTVEFIALDFVVTNAGSNLL